jgi:hypothetical protein
MTTNDPFGYVSDYCHMTFAPTFESEARHIVSSTDTFTIDQTELQGNIMKTRIIVKGLSATLFTTAIALTSTAFADGQLRGGMTDVKHVASSLAEGDRYASFKWQQANVKTSTNPQEWHSKGSATSTQSGVVADAKKVDANSSAHRWGIKADANQAAHRWGIKADADQAAHRWGIRADADQAAHRWGIKADANQAAHRWGIKADADQAAHRWGIKADADQAAHRWGIK